MQQYNTPKYNTIRYNAPFEGWRVDFVESMPLSQFSTYGNAMYNTVKYNANSTSDELSKSWSILITDSQYVQDNTVEKQPRKGFSEEVRLAAWLNNRRVNSANWSD